MSSQGGYIAVDLDGTLAHYVSWDGGKIGPPIPLMVARVKQWLAEGQRVKIMTARVASDPKGDRGRDVEEQRQRISDWCLEHLDQRLEVTCQKDYAMIRLYDDRCTEVVANTGRLATEYPYPQEAAVAMQGNLHPDEAKPRGETWLHERANWETEMNRLRVSREEQHHEIRWLREKIEALQEALTLTEEKRKQLDDFVRCAAGLGTEKIVATVDQFSDAEGAYVRATAKGREVMARYVAAITVSSIDSKDVLATGSDI